MHTRVLRYITRIELVLRKDLGCCVVRSRFACDCDFSTAQYLNALVLAMALAASCSHARGSPDEFHAI